MDLGILLDVSKFVTPASLIKAKAYIKEVIDCFVFSADKTRLVVLLLMLFVLFMLLLLFTLLLLLLFMLFMMLFKTRIEALLLN